MDDNVIYGKMTSSTTSESKSPPSITPYPSKVPNCYHSLAVNCQSVMDTYTRATQKVSALVKQKSGYSRQIFTASNITYLNITYQILAKSVIFGSSSIDLNTGNPAHIRNFFEKSDIFLVPLISSSALR